MKLITTLLATVLADCPRSWIVDPDDADKCIPDGINIQCNTNNMVVTFGLDHVYFEGDDFDATQKGLAAVDILDPSDDSEQTDAGCFDIEYNDTDEEFEVTVDLDACGVSATHEGDELIFTSRFIGDAAALTIDGIVLTKVLNFDATCAFPDSATVSVSDLIIETAAVDTTAYSTEGSYTFTLTTYSDSAMESAVSSSNKVEIGAPLYSKIATTDTLPTNVEFHATNCVAHEEYDSTTKESTGASYTIFDKFMCTADLIDASILDSTGDSTDAYTSFSFNSFTFATTEDELTLVCEVKLCIAGESSCFEDEPTDCDTSRALD